MHRSPARWVAGIISFAAALLYLSQWLQMPLYSDEVAFRLLRSRYLADGAINFGIFPCATNAQPIPMIFRPAGYLLSAADVKLGWSIVRLVPLAGVLLMLAATLTIILRRGGTAAALIAASGLIGVAGSGLILSRGEAPMLFLSVACLIGFAIAARRHVQPWACGLYLVVTTPLALLAIFVHVQAAILAPLLLLTAISLSMRNASRTVITLATLAALVILVGTWTALNNRIQCPEYPDIESMLAKSELPGFAREEGAAGVKAYLQEKLPRYSGQFLFKSNYDANYLPGIEGAPYGDGLSWLNAAIEAVVVFNLLVAGVVMMIAAAFSVRILLRGHSWKERLALFSGAPPAYLFLGLMGHLALLIDDVPTGFYRSFHIHFMLVMLNCLALLALHGRLKMLLWPVAIVSLTVSVASTIVTHTEMDAKFADGWQGAFIKLQTDWNAVRATVHQVAARCDIGATDSDIVIDDLTYDAMKRHKHLIPVTYLGFAVGAGASAPAALSKLLQGLSAKAVVTRCASLPVHGLKPEHEQDGICCLKLR